MKRLWDEPWLRLIASLEIDSRFQSTFSASDAVQQTMMEAWQHWDKFRGDDDLQRRYRENAVDASVGSFEDHVGF